MDSCADALGNSPDLIRVPLTKASPAAAVAATQASAGAALDLAKLVAVRELSLYLEMYFTTCSKREPNAMRWQKNSREFDFSRGLTCLAVREKIGTKKQHAPPIAGDCMSHQHCRKYSCPTCMIRPRVKCPARTSFCLLR